MELTESRSEGHRCRSRRPAEYEASDIASAILIFLSVAITLLEACFISRTTFRLFSNAVQALFAALFCSQQGYRLYAFACQRDTDALESVHLFFTSGKDAFWNVFDGILNILSILDIFVDTWEGRFVHGLAAMRVMRAFRLFRIFASNKFLNDFSRVMHTALIQMLNFCIVILVSLVLASVVATNMLWDFPNEQVAESYSDLGTTMWTLFKIMTMDGWISAIEPCLALHPSLLYFFALFVFFGLSSISIVPAIFIELLIEDREKRRNDRRKQKRRHKRQRRQRREEIQRAISMREISELPEPPHDDSDSCQSSSESTGSERNWRNEVNIMLQDLKRSSSGAQLHEEFYPAPSRRRTEYYPLPDDDLGVMHTQTTRRNSRSGQKEALAILQEMHVLHGSVMEELQELRREVREVSSLKKSPAESARAQKEKLETQKETEAATEAAQAAQGAGEASAQGAASAGSASDSEQLTEAEAAEVLGAPYSNW